MTSRVVPRDCTPAMFIAGTKALAEAIADEGSFARRVWYAMFDAAPACEPVPDAELDSLVQRLGDSDLMRELDAANAIAALRQQNAELREQSDAQRETGQQLFRVAQEQQRRAETAERERDELRSALQILHDETADYVRLNNLGDPYSNQSMRMARDALDKQGERK